MNGKERLGILREDIAGLKTPLNMRQYFNECGTAACAAGYACMNPLLQAEGLEIGKGDEVIRPHPVYKGAVGFNALSDFFSIPLGITLHLFSPLTYEDDYTNLDVLARIDEVLSKWDELQGKLS